MKQTRLAVIVLLIAMCAFSWFLVGRKLADTMGNLQSLIDQGHSYQERGLYEKAIESYNNAIARYHIVKDIGVIQSILPIKR